MSRKKELSEKDHQEVEAILEKIFDGLSGEFTKDIDYLNKNILKYCGHRLGKDILTGCLQIARIRFPRPIAEFLGAQLMKYLFGSSRRIDFAEILFMRGKYEKAIRILRNTKRRVLAATYAFDDTLAGKLCFANFFEESFCARFYKTKGCQHPTGHVFTRLYLLWGRILAVQGKIKEARKMWERAMRFAPVSFEVNALYAETFRTEKNLDEYRDQTLRLFKIAYRPDQIASCYQNLGDYFADQKIYDAAHVCYYLGIRFDTEDTDDNLRADYFRLERVSGIPYREIPAEEIDRICKERGIPNTPDPDILELAESSARFFHKRRQFDETRRFLDIFLRLAEPFGHTAKIEEIKALADEISEQGDKETRKKNDADGESEFL